MDDEHWDVFVQMAYMHRLLGVLGDTIDVSELSRRRRAQLAGELLMIEDAYSRRAALQEKVLELLRSNGISCIALKGISLAELYRKPEHRKFNDIDIYVPDNVGKACTLLHETCGASIKRQLNHHDKAIIDGITIELHRNLSNLAKYRSNRTFQKEMDVLYADGDMHTFHYLFLVHHALMHFVRSQLILINVADISMYENRYGQDIDWARVEKVADVCGFGRFLALIRSFLNDNGSKGVENIEYLLDMMHLPQDENTNPIVRTVDLFRSFRLHRIAHCHESILGIWYRTVIFWMRRQCDDCSKEN